jgi:hypothetical protein
MFTSESTAAVSSINKSPSLVGPRSRGHPSIGARLRGQILGTAANEVFDNAAAIQQSCTRGAKCGVAIVDQRNDELLQIPAGFAAACLCNQMKDGPGVIRQLRDRSTSRIRLRSVLRNRLCVTFRNLKDTVSPIP